MTLKTLLAAFVILAVPAIANAQCSGNYGLQEAAISCAEGSAWDPVAMTCVSSATS